MYSLGASGPILPRQHPSPVNFPNLSPGRIGLVAEDEEWIVWDKPPFQQVHPSKPGDQHTLWHELRELLAFEIVCGGQISFINRLDRETSGLTLIAKTHAAASAFGIEMMARAISKEYLAIVWGWPSETEWSIDAPILRQGEQMESPIYLKQTVHPAGAASRTRFRVEERLGTDGCRFSIVRAFPETGRMHQIRVHLSHSGYPIVGDKIYGPDALCYLEFIQTGWTPSLEKRLLLPRHALHSTYMRLHRSGMEWTVPLAPDLAEFTRKLKSGEPVVPSVAA